MLYKIYHSHYFQWWRGGGGREARGGARSEGGREKRGAGGLEAGFKLNLPNE